MLKKVIWLELLTRRESYCFQECLHVHALQRCSAYRVSVNEIILFVTRTERVPIKSPWPDVELIMGHRRPIINSI